MRWREVVFSLDWIIMATTLLLVCLGLAMLFSATYTDQTLLVSRFVRQAIVALIGLIGFLALARLPYHFFYRSSWVLYGLGIGGLLLVALTAPAVRGSASRLAVIGIQLQPSEFMKLALVLLLAYLFARSSRPNWKSVVTSCVLVAIPVFLVAVEPDTGVALLLLGLWAGLLVFIGLPWPALVSLFALAAVGAVAAWRWWLFEYQKNRILTFLNPQRDPLGAGYNVVQSIIALGSGRLLGRGLGHGPQSQLKFLPEQHTDFIVASIGEELGFIGILLLIILYSLLLWRIIVIAQRTNDRFGVLICVGTFIVLLSSLAVSIGMNMGLLPVTGIPLPLVSYGGSNLLTTFLLLGLVESVHVHSKWVSKAPAELTYVG